MRSWKRTWALFESKAIEIVEKRNGRPEMRKAEEQREEDRKRDEEEKRDKDNQQDKDEEISFFVSNSIYR